MSKLKLYGAIASLILLTVVILQNTAPVETRFLFATVVMPRAALLACSLLVGLLAGFALGMHYRRTRAPRDS